MYLQLSIGFLLAALTAVLAWRSKNLSTSGAIAATVLGTIVLGLGGWAWAALLYGFFISASALSKLFGRRKSSLDAAFSKGSQRDAGQVIANGGICGAFVLLHLLLPEANWVWLGFAGTLAAANADTWGTEIGVLSKRQPRLITSLKAVPRGTAGAVTVDGTLASFGGALFIAVLAVLVSPQASWGAAISSFLIIGLGGIMGALSDSWMSATVQGMYYCMTCGQETEHSEVHSCGNPTEFIRGWRWVNNDMVNLTANLIGGLFALIPFLAMG
jgi:uncharacterized protein (TIGR00297 family)